MNISVKIKKVFSFIFLLMASSLTYALSGENMAYMGVLNNGKYINAQYQSGPDEKNNWAWLFGDKKHNKYKTCWVIQKDQTSYFKCADKYDGKTTVQYKSLSNQDQQYSEAMEIYKKKLESCDMGVMIKFVCEIGCGNNTPKYIYEIGFDGSACSEEELQEMAMPKNK